MFLNDEISNVILCLYSKEIKGRTETISLNRREKVEDIKLIRGKKLSSFPKLETCDFSRKRKVWALNLKLFPSKNLSFPIINLFYQALHRWNKQDSQKLPVWKTLLSSLLRNLKEKKTK